MMVVKFSPNENKNKLNEDMWRPSGGKPFKKSIIIKVVVMPHMFYKTENKIKTLSQL